MICLRLSHLAALLCACGVAVQQSAGQAQSAKASAISATQHYSPYPPDGSRTGPAWFVDVAPQAGITVRNVNGNAEAKHYIIESTGSGVAIIDYDRVVSHLLSVYPEVCFLTLCLLLFVFSS